MGVEGLVRGRAQRLAPAGAFGPDQIGPVLCQRQDGEGAVRQEILMGDVAVRLLHADGADHAALLIGPAEDVDARRAAHGRVAALGPDDQRRRKGRTVLQRHRRPPRPDRHIGHGGGGANLQAPRLDGLSQGDAQAAILDHIAQRFAAVAIADLVRVEADIGGRRLAAGGAGTAAVRTAGVRLQRLAQAQSLQHAEVGVGDRRRPPVEGRRQLGVEGLRVHHDGPQPALRRRQRKGRSDQTCAGDDDVVVVRSAHAAVLGPYRTSRHHKPVCLMGHKGSSRQQRPGW